MRLVSSVVLALFFIYTAALVAWWAIPRGPRGIRIAIGLLAILVSGFGAMAIPLDARATRGGVAILGVVTAARITSYWFEAQSPVPLFEYFRFISIAMLRPHLVFSRHFLHAKPRIGREIIRLILCAAIIPPVWLIAAALNFLTIAQDIWLLNHLIVLAAFVVIIGCIGQCLLAIWRLQGLAIRHPVSDNILASRTPADFWRRWSWPPHTSIYRYIYQPLGGRAHHIRATMAVFLVSGVAHEGLAFAAIGRITGHQTLFFLLSGLGVLASPALERLATFGLAGQVLMHTLTLLFLIACSPIFFVTLNYVIPVYMQETWLMW
jgi:hypothetical protein